MSCKNNCGFHGSENFNGYCSQCFKLLDMKSVDTKHNEATTRNTVTITTPNTTTNTSTVTCVSKDIEMAKVPKNRCLICRKKVGIYGFSCKCEGYYCTVHRFPETHKCSYDFKLEGKMKITKENPIIIADKINRI